jgi:hypothetical protein
LPPEVAASFTTPQLDAVDLHFGMRHRVDHAINWRRRIGLPFMKFYLVVLAGRENRGAERI